MGKGAVRAHIEVPQTRGKHVSSVAGSLGKFEPEELNSMLLFAAGVKLKRGQMDTVSFNFKVANGLSSGQFSSIFDSLNLEIVNRVSRSAGSRKS
jgi:hypothetical protein